MTRHRLRTLCGFALAAAALAPALAAPRKVVIDQDAFGPAGSNMQAILMLLQAKDVEVLGITVTSGDGWRDENVSHALRLLEVAKREDVPVLPGAVWPLVNSERRTKAWEARYGRLFYKGAWTESWTEQGVDRAPFHAPDVVPPSKAGEPRLKASTEAAANFLVRQVKAHPGEVTIVACGPLTNLALAARLDPDFARNAKELVFMGGSFNPQPADNPFAAEYAHNPRLEFNLRSDPEAASAVLHEPWRRVVQVPVDPSTRTFFRKALIERVAAGRAPFAAYLGQFGQSYPMWDEIAVAVWLDPSIVTRRETLAVDVDTDGGGAGYGSTLSWPAGHGPGLGERDVEVIREVDVPRLEAMTLELLGAR